MEKLNKEEFNELDLMCKEITILKLKRLEKFGNSWQLKLKGFGRERRTKNRVEQNVIDKYLRKMDEVMALKGYTKGALCGKLKISRNLYFDLTNGYCSNRVDKMLNDINWDSI